MKKISKLLPLIGLTGIATVTMPLVCCGNGDTPPDPDPDPDPEPVVGAWYLNDAYLDSLTKDDVGTINTIKVNNITHRVRLIGVDYDTLADGSGKAHTTWEFVDVISDELGYSLTTFWNDIPGDVDEGEFYPCGDYMNSSLRWALVGNGESVSHGWYERPCDALDYDEAPVSKSTNYKKPVIDMLPSDLVEKMKPVNKQVDYFDDENVEFVTKTCSDKLFVLSTNELYPDPDLTNEDKRYDFYKKAHEYSWFIKKQVVGCQTGKSFERAIEVKDAQYTGYAECISGYNSTVGSSGTYWAGTGYWLRNIDITGINAKGQPAGVSSQGSYCFGPHGDGNAQAATIAPAFCL